MATYNTNDEILAAIDDHERIKGIVEAEPFHDMDIDQYNEEMCNKLIGEEWGYLLEEIYYTLVGCDIENQTILVEVDASAVSLLAETELGELKK